jgi:NTE family protein
MQKIGYVLSGGGARGFAHLGVLKMLEEIGLRPHAISGTSAGAMAGALYASGKGPEEILDLMKNYKYFGWTSISFKRDGFFSMDMLKTVLKDNIGHNDFNLLKTKLFVTATDLIKGEPVIFSSGELAEAVIASSSVPVLFEPVKFDGKLLVDGGVLNNFPVEPLRQTCNIIIGSYVNNVADGFSGNSFFKSVDILDRCFHLAIANSVYSKAGQCDLFIDIPLFKYDIYDVRKADEIFEIGYNTAKQYRDKLTEKFSTANDQIC